jgi:type IV pilus assembly protein PilV
MADCRASSAGVALIEATVSLLLLSLASVAMAGLQLSAGRANFEAAQRSTATALAADILERMRANPAALENYAIDEQAGSEASSPAVVCSLESCSAGELARRDIRDWRDALQGRDRDGEPVAGSLRDARPCIAITGRIAEVVIAWSGQGLTKRTAGDIGCGAELGERRLLLRMQGFIPERVE